jgi:hypothetical protein
MCGGVRFPYTPEQTAALESYYRADQIASFATRGVVESVFWQPQPILPVGEANSARIVRWGNRDKQLALPASGWIRNESLVAGKWDRWRPYPVVIPAFAGVEKGIWFTIDHGVQGYAVYSHDVEHVYMLTFAADAGFRDLTGHDRMPALIDQTRIAPIEDKSQQAGLQ